MKAFSMSKSKYCKGIQCPKILWMDRNMPDKAVETTSEDIFNTGTEVGKLAREYFQNCQTVAFSYDKAEMCRDTNALIANGARVIAEASFLYENNFCSVDILRIVGSEVQLIEVKSSTEIHDIYYDGESHYYIDGTVLDSGVIPVLLVDTEADKYYRVTESGNWLILPYDEEN